MDIELGTSGDLRSSWREWEELFRRDELATPFNSPEWGRAWLDSWGADVEPWLLRVHDGGRIAGIAPMALRRDLPARVLTMVGKDPGDYWDVIAAPADRQRVAHAVGAELVRRAREWDAGVLNCFPPGSGTLENFAVAGLRVFRRPSVASPAIELPATFDAYLATLPASRRQNLRRHLRRLDSGEVHLREIDDPTDLAEVMQRWRALRSLQWRARGRRITPSHETDHFHRFMLDAVTRMLPLGMAVVWEFSWTDRVVGVYVNFADEQSFYWYLGGFDPEVAHLGLGKIAVGAAIRASIAAGRQRFDFTRGDDAYKYWYGAADRMLASVIIGHRRLRSRIAMTAAMGLSSYRAYTSSRRKVAGNQLQKVDQPLRQPRWPAPRKCDRSAAGSLL